MKNFLIFVIASVIVQEGLASGEVLVKQCTHRNEIYQECGTCPLTCDNYENPPACDGKCVKGCNCAKGFVRHTDGNCCLTSECKPEVIQPKICPQHETYSDCGTACPLTCDNYKTPQICTLQCVQGCGCNEGYVRNKYGKCCLPQECEPKVLCKGKHEVYVDCCTACPATCDNYKNPIFCRAKCQPGCCCEKDYVRNKAGECVQPSKCKDRCKATKCLRKVIEPQQPTCKGVNEVFQSCGTLCPKTCATKDVMFKCQEGCQPGCFCADGFLRNCENKCVLISHCD